MTTLTLPEPDIREKDRSKQALYDTGRVILPSEYEREEKKILFELSVSYSKAGSNYFTGEYVGTDFYSVAVRNWTLSPSGIMGTVMMGKNGGLGITRIKQPNNRFSRKRLGIHFDEWREQVEGWLSLDDDSLHHLSDSERHIRAAVLPYWQGEKTGLA